MTSIIVSVDKPHPFKVKGVTHMITLSVSERNKITLSNER